MHERLLKTSSGENFEVLLTKNFRGKKHFAETNHERSWLR